MKLVQLREPSSQFDYGAIAKERACNTELEVKETVARYKRAIRELGFNRHTILVKPA